jgi:hypothetical protein
LSLLTSIAPNLQQFPTSKTSLPALTIWKRSLWQNELDTIWWPCNCNCALFLNRYIIQSQPRFLVHFNIILTIGTARTLDLLFWIRAQLVQRITKTEYVINNIGYVYMVIHLKALFLEVFVPSWRTYEIALSFLTSVSLSLMISRLPRENIEVLCRRFVEA